MDLSNLIVKILLIFLLILQIIVLIYTLITMIKRNKDDRKFWEHMNNAVKIQVDKYNNLYPEEPLSLEGNENESNE